MSILRFTVPGIPVPQGSMSAFMPKGWNRPILTSANKKLKPWRALVAQAARDAMMKQGFTMAGKDVPFGIELIFRYARPKSDKRVYMTKRPDLDKNVRSVGDSLTGVVWKDDSQLVKIIASKEYGEPGVEILLWEMVEEPHGVPVIPEWTSIPF